MNIPRDTVYQWTVRRLISTQTCFLLRTGSIKVLALEWYQKWADLKWHDSTFLVSPCLATDFIFDKTNQAQKFLFPEPPLEQWIKEGLHIFIGFKYWLNPRKFSLQWEDVPNTFLSDSEQRVLRNFRPLCAAIIKSAFTRNHVHMIPSYLQKINGGGGGCVKVG